MYDFFIDTSSLFDNVLYHTWTDFRVYISILTPSITSGKKILIEQDIYSQIYVANILQSFINDAEKEIEQSKYKNKMKINCNMAIGILKNSFIYIVLERNSTKRNKMIDNLEKAIEEHLVPVKDGRNNPRNSNPKNKHNLNQRRSF